MKSESQQLTLSDEDEPGITFTVGNPAATADDDDEKRKMCPWQRMKWTDAMVRLLITVVYCIGDEVGSSSDQGNIIADHPSGKKKNCGGGMLQKKGKWKSVSRAMMERGFYVSPQQCEDKFNDLNKRYKRVNDILGKGTACLVVENQKLLETMDHLSPKMKEEAKKLLNSKHLFFREMCAYHKSCSHGAAATASGSAGAAAHQSPEMVVIQSPQTDHEKQRCLNSSGITSRRPNSDGDDQEDGDDVEDDDTEDDEEEEEEEDVEEVEVEGSGRSHQEERGGKISSGRKRKGMMFVSPMIEKLRSELTGVIDDGSRSVGEKRKWMRVQMMQLEEQRVEYESQAFELERQWLKWRKFSSKKEMEMEREKLLNEQTRLDNERMVLLLRQKEFEMADLQQQEPSHNKE